MVSKSSRSARIEIRTTDDAKDLLVRAAAASGSDLTSFIMNSALTTARDVVDSVERIELGREDAMRVLDRLEHPPAPTETMIDLAKRYRQRRDRVG